MDNYLVSLTTIPRRFNTTLPAVIESIKKQTIRCKIIINIPHKYLKSVKFIKSNNYQTAIEQIIFIRKEIKEICKKKRHIDLTFEKA